MSVETVDVGVSDKEIFAGVLGDEPAEQVTERTEVQPEPERSDRTRDEQGRFAKVEPKVEAKVETQANTQQPVTEKTEAEAQVPSWRLREIREERETIARQLEQERQTRVRLEREMQQFRAQQQQTPAPDIFQDPNAWQQHLSGQFQSQLETLRFSQSEILARDKFGDEKVDTAYRWAETNLGPAERARMQNARSPYHELVKLYDERQTLSQIGGDLNAYRTKVMEEALNDPAFMQKVADKLRGTSQPNGRPPVSMPPSLNRATGVGDKGENLTDADMSSGSLFKHAFAK